MQSTVINSGAPYVFVVSVADAADVTASGGGSAPFTLPLDKGFPLIQSLAPSADGTLATGGVQSGTVAFNPTGAALPVVFLSTLGVGGACGEGETAVQLVLNADGTPVLDGTTHTPTVRLSAGTLTAGKVLWVALVPGSF